MKTVFKKILKDINGINQNAPDYEGFAKINNQYVFIRGWYKLLSSDLNIYIDNVDDEWISKNKYNSTKFVNWLKENNEKKS
jgi:hypothetical protein